MIIILNLNGIASESNFQIHNSNYSNEFLNVKTKGINNTQIIKMPKNKLINNSSQLSSTNNEKNRSTSVRKKIDTEIKTLSDKISNSKANRKIIKSNYRKKNRSITSIKTINIIKDKDKKVLSQSPQIVFRNNTEHNKLPTNLKFKIIQDNKQNISERRNNNLFHKNPNKNKNRSGGIYNSLIPSTNTQMNFINKTNQKGYSYQVNNSTLRESSECEDSKYKTKYSFEKRYTDKGDFPKRIYNIRKNNVGRNLQSISQVRNFTQNDSSNFYLSSFIMKVFVNRNH